TNQGDVIAELHREARRRIDAGVSQQSHDDRVTDAMLLELQIEIGVGETALSPMLADDDIAVARREIGMKLTTPRRLRERMASHDAPLSGIDVPPALVVALFPLAMRNDEDSNACSPDCRVYRMEIREQSDFLCDLLQARPQEATLGQEVVV